MPSFILLGLGPDPRMYPDPDPNPGPFSGDRPDLPLTYKEMPPPATEPDDSPVLDLLGLLFCLLEAL